MQVTTGSVNILAARWFRRQYIDPTKERLVPFAGPELQQPVQLVNLLDVGLKSKPDEPALVLLHRTWSWRELDVDSTRLAKNYLAMGLAPGDRVASLLPNRGALI